MIRNDPAAKRGIGMAALVCSAGVAVVIALGCTAQAFLNATAPLGDAILINADVARLNNGERRGRLGVGFINKTSFRAIGTFGGYDPQDKETIVTFGQLGVTLQYDLEPNVVSRVYSIPVTRAFTLGGQRLIELIFEQDRESQNAQLASYPTDAALGTFLPDLDLLNEKIGFTGAPFGDPQDSVPTQGTAESSTVYIGQHYRQDSLLIFRFSADPNAAGGFRIDFTTARDLGVDVDRLIRLVANRRAVALAPLGLDRYTFQLLTALGLGSAQADLFDLRAGATPDRVEVTVNNQTVANASISFFGPETKVMEVITGEQEQTTLLPGTYEYLIAYSADVSVLFNTQALNAGILAELTLE